VSNINKSGIDLRVFSSWVQVYDRTILKVDNNDVNLRLKA